MPLGIAEARQQLSYINQYRELALGFLFAALVSLRILGWPIPPFSLVLLAAWLLLAIGFVRWSQKLLDLGRLYQVEFAYFLCEIALITWVALGVRSGLWLALLFFLVTMLHANMVLPRLAARGITALATLGFTLLAVPRWHLGSWPLPPRTLGELAVVALLVYVLAGLNLSQFALVLRRQSEALLRANHKLSATTRELRLHRDHLEDLVRQRTLDLERAGEDLRRINADLRRLNELKSHFLANVSHELRTPLTSIRSFSELLLHYPDEDEATRNEFLGIIRGESDRLTRMIDEVLDLARIEAGRLELHRRPVRLGELIQDSLDMFQVLAGQRDLRLEWRPEGELPPVMADPDRVRQVLTNLLSNAFKFTPNGGIEITAAVDEGAVRVAITDTGRGLAPGEEERIFDKFHQSGDSLTGKPEGAGLGLAICREICQGHGGRIWAERVASGGSRFCFTLPLAEIPAAVAASGSG